jgi:hypothetical protein
VGAVFGDLSFDVQSRRSVMARWDTDGFRLILGLLL